MKKSMEKSMEKYGVFSSCDDGRNDDGRNDDFSKFGDFWEFGVKLNFFKF